MQHLLYIKGDILNKCGKMEYLIKYVWMKGYNLRNIISPETHTFNKTNLKWIKRLICKN